MSDKELTLSWPEIIEAEINRRTGGDATVGEIVALMIELGWWEPPSPVYGFPPAEEETGT